jgi:arginase family enzyme
VTKPVILDFDGAAGPLPDSVVIPLQERQEAIRFGCRVATLRALGRELAPVLSPLPTIVFMGSGDYHHVSYLLIERLRCLSKPVQVVVFDNHPDNMRYPFGIHCGSWVRHVSRLSFVSCVHVIGITSGDVQGAHLWENHLLPLYTGRVRYWCVGRDLGAMRVLGIRQSQSFATVNDLLDRFAAESRTWTDPIYLSIDKDVLSRDVVQTNWDQGVMTLEELERAIGMVRHLVIASDVTGEVSSYRFSTRYKQILSALDHQPKLPASSFERWQEQHQAVNRRLLSALADAGENVRQHSRDAVEVALQ